MSPINGAEVKLKRRHVWLEIIVLCTVVACSLACLLAGVVAAAAEVNQSPLVGSSDSSQRTFEGMVSCSRCEAKHSAALARSASTCVRVCVHGGARFTLIAPQSTYFLEGDLLVLKPVAGQRVRIQGTLNGQVIRVSSLVPES